MNRVRLINLPKIEELRGNLTFIEKDNLIPLEINRIYWIYDMTGGKREADMSLKKRNEFIVALFGSFDMVVDGRKIENAGMAIKLPAWNILRGGKTGYQPNTF